MKHKLVLLFLLFINATAIAQIPVISSFSPVSGAMGTKVTISGANFSATPSKNVVFFGGARANIISASSNSLIVTVPPGAGYGAISVATRYLTAYSTQSFVVTYPGGGMFGGNNPFAPETNFVVNNSAPSTGILAADFDGDGKTDVAVMINGVGISLYKNSGNNTTPFNSLASAKIAITGTTLALVYNSIAIGDFNGDGKPDIVICAANNIIVCKNTSIPGTISFAVPIVITTTPQSAGVAVGDFNDDGKLDIATTNGGSFSVLLNNGSGNNISFAAPQLFHINTSAQGIAVGDADGDGKLDIVLADNQNGNLIINRNTTTGGVLSFAPGVSYYDVYGPEHIIMADLDGDGKPDIIATNAVTNVNTIKGSLLRNTSTPGNISFEAETHFLQGFSDAPNFTIADINGDGKPDLVLADNEVLENQSTPGNINMAARVAIPGLDGASTLTVTDFTGDGKPDVAMAKNPGYSQGFPSSLGIAINQVNPLSPAITTFAPDSAIIGETITITGVNFTGASAVSFGGVPAASFNVQSPTIITAVVAVGSVSGDVTIVNPAGQTKYPGFIVIGKPVITAANSIDTTVTPHQIAMGGSNLLNATSVTLDGVPVTSIIENTDIQIRATTNAKHYNRVAVRTRAGTTTYYYGRQVAINSFSPTSASPGSSVTIKGSGFTYANSVAIGGVPVSSFTINSNNTITAIAGIGTAGKVTVTGDDNTATSYESILFTGPPVLESFSPTSGDLAGPSSIILTGLNFPQSDTHVTFGGGGSTTAYMNTPTRFSVYILPGAASGDVVVTTPYGSSSLPGFTFVPTPSITSFSGGSQRGSTVTITGTVLNQVTAVRFGSVPAKSFVINSPTSITAVVAAGNYTTDTTDVTLIFPRGISYKHGFVYTPTAPGVASFSPTHTASGQVINIQGADFYIVSSVKFGGIDAASFIVNSPTSITAMVGAGASGAVRVTTALGAATKSGFVVQGPPVITSFTPAEAGPNTSINIKGSDFSGATGVTFGGNTASSFTVLSDTTMSAVIGSGQSGAVQVITEAGSGSLDGFIYDSPPYITSVTPMAGTTGTVINIRGTSLKTATSVSFGGVPAQALTIHSDNYLSARVGAGASGNIMVTTSFGTDSLAGFVFDAPLSLAALTPGGKIVSNSGNLSIFYTLSGNKKNLNLSLSGSPVYHINLNGTLYTTTDSTTTLPLVHGKNELTVVTDKLSQGAIRRIIMASDDIIPYPDPFENTLYLNLGDRKPASANVEIYSGMGVVIYQKQFSNPLNIIQLDVPAVNIKGIYTLKLTLDGIPNVYKVIRQ